MPNSELFTPRTTRSTSVRVTMTLAERDALREQAANRDVTQADLVRSALGAYLSEPEHKADQATAA